MSLHSKITNLKLYKVLLFFVVVAFGAANVHAQEGVSETGGWYQYIWSKKIGDKGWGVNGDFQYRDFEGLGDFQQFIARAAATYNFKDTPLTVTSGYAYFSTGTFGESQNTVAEHRLHQDILLPQKVSEHLYLGHRIRIEERFIDNQDFRTRYRYMLAARVPLNGKGLGQNALYAMGWSEVFVNGQQDIGDGRSVSLFDRNWSAIGLGYGFTNKLKLELNYMREITDAYTKGQVIVHVSHAL